MDELVANPKGCTYFEPNPFKPDKCKTCGCSWFQHKDVISDDLLRGFLESRRKAALEKQKKEEQDKKEARAKKAQKKKDNRAVEDDWFFDAAEADHGDHDSDSEDDAGGFQMFAGGQIQTAPITQLDSERRPSQLKVVNLINFGECDVSGEAPAVSADVAHTQSLLKAGVAETAILEDGFDSHDVEAQLQEIEYLKRRLATLNEEKRVELEILQEQLDVEKATSSQLREEIEHMSSKVRETKTECDASLSEDVCLLMQDLSDANEEKFSAISTLLDKLELVKQECQEKDVALQEMRAQLDAMKDRDVADHKQVVDASTAPCLLDGLPNQDAATNTEDDACEAPSHLSDVAHTFIDEIAGLCSQSRLSLSGKIGVALDELPDRHACEKDGKPSIEDELAWLSDIVKSLNDLIHNSHIGDVESVKPVHVDNEKTEPVLTEPEPSQATRDVTALKTNAAPSQAAGAVGATPGHTLSICKRFCTAAGVAVQSLSTAGSGLQQVITVNTRDPDAGIASLVDNEDPIVQHTARCITSALQCVSIALIDLASALSVHILRPLEDMHRDVTSKHAAKTSELAMLRQRRQVCTEAITSSLQRSQTLAAQGQIPSDGFLAWLAKPNPDEEIKRLQQDERRTVEDHSAQILALVQTEQALCVSLDEELTLIDKEMKTAIASSLSTFPSSWASIVHSMDKQFETLSYEGT